MKLTEVSTNSQDIFPFAAPLGDRAGGGGGGGPTVTFYPVIFGAQMRGG